MSEPVGSSTDGAIALALTAITKRFGATLALDDVSFRVRRGTVHALLGENGAGKTTLMRIAFGMIAPDAGQVSVDGTVRRFGSPADAIAAGVGMVHQHFTLVPAMTVVENVALGGRGVYRRAVVQKRVLAVSERSGLGIDPDAVVGTLPVGAQQRVEILKALVRDARMLILDEPTAVLAPGEARELLRTVREFVARGGSVVLITHKLRDALEFADEVSVVRRGRLVLTDRVGGLDEQALADAMIGSGRNAGLAVRGVLKRATAPQRPFEDPSDRQTRSGDRGMLQLRGVTVRDAMGVERLRGVTLAVQGGEIVGVAAVEGNGQSELVRVLAGRMAATEGSVVRPDAVGFVPEDRQRDALVLDFSLYENVGLFRVGQRSGWMRWEEVRRRTEGVMTAYDVRAAGVGARARALSGGNQQKLVVGREIDGAPRALVVENPTRGLDVHATAAVHQRLLEARDRGAAVVVYSSDLDEVLELADRVVVVYGGMVSEVPREREAVGRAMVGGV
ncbi:MAG TPA: ABC transporter ATP-binding protein [Gemmatimonadaceae bacterium]|nr:ABC transporter ATP-binding protein [Gemmatimonadaceae bacterium]